jgi:hypothetical protein
VPTPPPPKAPAAAEFLSKSALGTKTPAGGRGSPTASMQVEPPKSPSHSRELEVSDFMGEQGFGASAFGGPGAAAGKPAGDSAFGEPTFGGPAAAMGKPTEDHGFGGAAFAGGSKAGGLIPGEDAGFGSPAFGAPRAAAGKLLDPLTPFVGGNSNQKNLNTVVQASSSIVSHLLLLPPPPLRPRGPR